MYDGAFATDRGADPDRSQRQCRCLDRCARIHPAAVTGARFDHVGDAVGPLARHQMMDEQADCQAADGRNCEHQPPR